MADDEPAATTRAELFALPSNEFVAARDDLVRRLKSDGEADRAAAVKKLRRPTLAAWAVNQVVRAHPDEFGELVAAGEQVQRAQRRALSGVRDSGLREASTTRRELVEQLTDLAGAALADAGARPDSHLDDVAATFEAASASPDVAEEVGAGCLSAPIRVETDFGSAGALFAVPVDEDGQDDTDDAAAEQRRAAIRALEHAQARATASSTAAREAREEAAALAQQAEQARRDADAAREAADRAETEATELATRAEQAEADAATAASAAAADAEDAEQARTALADLA